LVRASFLLLLIIWLCRVEPAPFPDLSELVEKVAPAVVQIRIVPKTQGDQESELGSGFILSPDGLVLTSAHLVEDAEAISVRLYDGREAFAKLLGSDPRSDLALLKIPANHLPSLTLASASGQGLRVGEWVVAIGSPFGFDHTVTVGIISAKNRLLPENPLIPLLQTDAAVNPGSSGGPLLNLRGQVVGVNTLIFSRTGSFAGLAFAVPSEVARFVIDQIRRNGKVEWGWIGLEVQEVTTPLAEAFHLREPRGLVVVKTFPGGPAERAGLKIGDILLYLNGTPLARRSDLLPAIAKMAIGSKISLLFQRRGHLIEAEVEVAAAPEESTLPSQERRGALIPRLGLLVEESPEGLVVRRVVAKEARQAGIEEGDLLLAVAEVQVATLKELKGTVQAVKGWIPLLIQREGEARYVVLKP